MHGRYRQLEARTIRGCAANGAASCPGHRRPLTSLPGALLLPFCRRFSFSSSLSNTPLKLDPTFINGGNILERAVRDIGTQSRLPYSTRNRSQSLRPVSLPSDVPHTALGPHVIGRAQQYIFGSGCRGVLFQPRDQSNVVLTHRLKCT